LHSDVPLVRELNFTICPTLTIAPKNDSILVYNFTKGAEVVIKDSQKYFSEMFEITGPAAPAGCANITVGLYLDEGYTRPVPPTLLSFEPDGTAKMKASEGGLFKVFVQGCVSKNASCAAKELHIEVCGAEEIKETTPGVLELKAWMSKTLKVKDA
jgi:hypothetical protein